MITLFIIFSILISGVICLFLVVFLSAALLPLMTDIALFNIINMLIHKKK